MRAEEVDAELQRLWQEVGKAEAAFREHRLTGFRVARGDTNTLKALADPWTPEWQARYRELEQLRARADAALFDYELRTGRREGGAGDVVNEVAQPPGDE